MFFQSWSDFFNMGGYGFYVWLSYGISFVAILVLVHNSYKGRNAILRDVKREQVREDRLKSVKMGSGL
ncbi:MAG: heme exporter protein CcmD [[Actinobacillus] rossii]|uniref:Heme exporter protein D n=1 Tax=[Actinobacillus] rossii TaxID=123820 RepID=A0A380TRD4_9PAST|nr:heme exporter protein CcmD [[Actinobacillus] rossii]MDY3122972.1 heme exporter protein CcmD [[Actinobacillus] rossii]MDY4505225.1 heme exporter protein CcmD [[Actinobacillus] rossii]SUT90790.1 Heme exporter protein CcmD [[Actinobacillus] rossii]